MLRALDHNTPIDVEGNTQPDKVPSHEKGYPINPPEPLPKRVTLDRAAGGKLGL